MDAVRSDRSPLNLSIKPTYTFVAAALLLILGWIAIPLIANAVTEPAPPYVSHDPATVLFNKGIDWNVEVSKPQTVEQMVSASFIDAPIMYRIARAESQFDPKAKNPNSTATGVFQILIGTWHAYGCTGERTNAADNIACARKIYEDGGTTAWNSSKANW